MLRIALCTAHRLQASHLRFGVVARPTARLAALSSPFSAPQRRRESVTRGSSKGGLLWAPIDVPPHGSEPPPVSGWPRNRRLPPDVCHGLRSRVPILEVLAVKHAESAAPEQFDSAHLMLHCGALHRPITVQWGPRVQPLASALFGTARSQPMRSTSTAHQDDFVALSKGSTLCLTACIGCKRRAIGLSRPSTPLRRTGTGPSVARHRTGSHAEPCNGLGMQRLASDAAQRQGCGGAAEQP